MSADALHTLSLAAAARAIRNREVRSTELVEACLARIDAREGTVRAWVHLDPERARREAKERDASRPKGALHGIPIGVKDIIDTRDFPTERGSALFSGRRPEADAVCVTRLREAGAIILGKTVTTEFAFFAPGPTTNPHDSGHTPGGSSSGSAAAVADFHVPCALGTQTAGSIIRPASFCGVIGWKPTHGRFPMEGVLPLAPSLDTLGFFCRDIDDIPLVGAAMSAWQNGRAPDLPRVAWIPTPYWHQASRPMREALDAYVHALGSSGVSVKTVEATAFEGLAEVQNTLLAQEAQETLAPLVAADPTLVRPQTLALLEASERIGNDFAGLLESALHRARSFIESEVFAEADLILTPAAPGEAPKGLDATGDPLFNRIWT
ncbi:MAG: amidase, partial [Myxococcales bacterium]|nr:amidase [Myxococcales bacterium]